MTIVHVEYRIPLPLTLSQYNISQLYIVSKLSKTETQGDTSIKILLNEDYTHEVFGPCRKTLKLLNLNSKVPSIIKALVPSRKALQMEELAFNAFPRCCTTYKNMYFSPDTVNITVNSMHIESKEYINNANDIPDSVYKKTKIKILNIAENIQDKNFDPRKATNKYGSLAKDWIDKAENLMVCYKHVTVEVNSFMMGWAANEIEKQLSNLFLRTHQQLFCEMDEWIGLSMDDIRKMEEETKKELDEVEVKEEE